MANPTGWHRKNTTPAETARRAKYNSPQHRAARAAFTVLIATGRGICWRCQRPIPPGTPGRAWNVGHDDDQVDLIRGPEHTRCNKSAAARKGARIANAQRTTKRAATRLTW